MCVCLSVCTPLFSEVLRHVARPPNLVRGCGLDQGRPSSNASATRCREGVIHGQMGSNPYSLSYGNETWRVERSSDAENVECQLGVKWGQILTDSHMKAKLGGWNRYPMPKMLKVS